MDIERTHEKLFLCLYSKKLIYLLSRPEKVKVQRV